LAQRLAKNYRASTGLEKGPTGSCGIILGRKKIE